MNQFLRRTQAYDCQIRGTSSDAELFIVEGESASMAVAAIRDVRFQAVLPMQGKPLNASKASLKSIQQYAWFRTLLESLGYRQLCAATKLDVDCISANDCRFARVILLFDPDADGIHCGALMTIFFYRMLRPLLSGGRICLVRAPRVRFEVESTVPSESGNLTDRVTGRERLPGRKQILYAYSDDHARSIERELRAEGYRFERERYRGLASIRRETLLSTCVAPGTRQIYRLQEQDALAAISVFGGNSFFRQPQ